jgi:hypothetical protein
VDRSRKKLRPRRPAPTRTISVIAISPITKTPRSRWLAAPSAVTAGAGNQCFLEISRGGAPGDKEPEPDSDSRDCGQSGQQNRYVDGNALQPWQIRRQDCGEGADRPSSRQNAQHISSQGKGQRLGEQLLQETPAPSP